MKKLILTSAVGALALLVSACGDGAEDADTAEADAAAMTDDMAAGGATTAGADWPAGTRIVDEGGTSYRVNPDGTRVVISDGAWRIVTEGDERFRVNDSGTRIRIDERGVDLDLDGPDIDGVDVDLGTNRNGNLDLDVSTDGTDASPDDR